MSTANLHRSSTSAILKDIKAREKQTSSQYNLYKNDIVPVTSPMKVTEMIFLLYQNSKLTFTNHIQNHIQIWVDYFSWFHGVIFHTNQIYKDGVFSMQLKGYLHMKTLFLFLKRFPYRIPYLILNDIFLSIKITGAF